MGYNKATDGSQVMSQTDGQGNQVAGPTDAAIPGGAVLVGGKSPTGVQRPVAVAEDGKLEGNFTLVADILGVGNIFGFDNSPSAWATYSGTPEAGNEVSVSVGSISKVYVAQASDTIESIAKAMADLFNADTAFAQEFLSTNFQRITFFRSKDQGDKNGGTAITAMVAQGAATGLDMSVELNDATLEKMFKRILVELDEEDLRVGRIGVFGEVGTRTRADNPVFLSVRKVLATQNESLFFDKNVTDLTANPNIDLAFITDMLIADDVAGELRIYKGLERGRIEDFIGDGTSREFVLDSTSIAVSSHISVEVNGVPQVFGADFSVEDTADPLRNKIVFTTPNPGAPGSGIPIQVTYDSTQRLLVAFVQASSSQAIQFGAPIKLERTAGHFLVATVVNKSANASTVAVNANGFFELVRGVIT